MLEPSVGVMLPRYKCHKEVHAAKITRIDKDESPGATLRFGEAYAFHKVDESWMTRFKPEVGGYYVVYEDGYASFSPVKAFESGYELIR